MKHTPAPWKNRTAGDPTDKNGMQIYAGKNNIATAHYGAEIDTNAAVANARLIAAAPELLEALQNLMAQAVKDAEKYAPEGNESIWAFISDASTSIHKATT